MRFLMSLYHELVFSMTYFDDLVSFSAFIIVILHKVVLQHFCNYYVSILESRFSC